MIWLYVFIGVLVFDLGFVAGCAWRASRSVSLDVFQHALDQLDVSMARERVVQRLIIAERANRPAEDPDRIPWEVIGG